MDLSDPRLAQLLTDMVDRRVRAAIAMAATIRYGIVSAVDATAGVASVMLGGSPDASPGFNFPAYLAPKVGDQVRVVIRGADRYIEANLDGAASAPVASAGLLYGQTWMKSSSPITLAADTETDVPSDFRVTWPGNPAMAGRFAVLRPWTDVSLTWSVANTEGGVFLYSTPASDDIGGERIRWQRQRLPATANTMTSYHLADAIAYPAGAPVEFRIRVRMAAAGTCSFYANASARYVSRIGYSLVGYSATPTPPVAVGRPGDPDDWPLVL